MKSLIKSRCIFVSLICLFLAYNAKPIFAEVIWQTFSANNKAEGGVAEAAFREAAGQVLTEILFENASDGGSVFNYYEDLGVIFELRCYNTIGR